MQTQNRDGSRLWIILLLLIISCAAVLRVWTIGYKAPWLDEIHSLVYARNSFSHLIDIGRTTDIHPPLYFLALKGWGAIFGESREAARLFSGVLGLISILLLFFITRRILNTPAALIAAGFIATFPTAVYYTREIRMYPLLTVLFLASFYFFLHFVDTDKKKEQRTPGLGHVLPLAGFSVFLALTFYTHYSAAILYMLYTLAALYSLGRGQKAAFFWTFLGLFIATVLVLPQLVHLFSSSLGDPDKGWMEATTLRIFYGTTMGAFPYPAVLKPLVLLVFAIGLGLLWMRDKSIAGIVFLFTGGGMLLAAAIGIVEPIYLVRTIQIYTVFTGILVAVVLLWVPRALGVALGSVLIVVNVYTIAQDQFLPKRMPLLADDIPPLVALLDKDRDQVFAKSYLQRQSRLMRVPLFEYAQVIDHETQEADLAVIDAQAARCLGSGADPACRSVILILEKESLFNVEAIAAWNAMADALKADHAGHIERQVATYRVVVLSNDAEFLAQADAALQGSSQ